MERPSFSWKSNGWVSPCGRYLRKIFLSKMNDLLKPTLIFSDRPALCSVLFALVSMFAPGKLAAQNSQASSNDNAARGARTADLRLAEDAVTKGTVSLRNGQHLPYTAQAGILAVGGTDAQDLEVSAPDRLTGIVHTPEDGAIAAMSYVAYFADNVDPRTRPIIFLYDGGPSVSTRTLLVGSFGPIVADLPGLHHFAGGPYNFTNNVDSLLDVADLVFVDPPGTGYGRIQGRNAARAFYGIDGDAAAYDRFIRRFLSKYSRGESPKYLFGHSYGTTRNAVLARMLEEDGVDLNGVIADGSFLNRDDFPDAASGIPGTDNPYILQLSTFAATAWFHHRIVGASSELEPWLRSVEHYAAGPYATALLAGSDLSPAEEQTIATQLGQFTGLPAQVWMKAHLRLQAAEFEALLLSDKGLITGRQDTRYTAPALHALSTRPGYDASSVKGSTVLAVIDTYMHGTLRFGLGLNYQPDADIPGQWDDVHVTDETKPWLGVWNVLPDLATVMTRNAAMRVIVMGGYFDLATPYEAGIFEMKHLPMEPKLQQNIDYAVFPTGHEPYLDPESREKMHSDVAQFITKTRESH